MRWEGNRESDNVEDRRDDGGGGGSPVFGGRSIGIGTIVIALVGGWVLGINPLTILGLLSGGGPAPQVQTQPHTPAHRPPADDTAWHVSCPRCLRTRRTCGMANCSARAAGSYQEPAAGVVPGRHAHRLWHGPGRHGAVLLPG
jgi:predicted metalloprotease